MSRSTVQNQTKNSVCITVKNEKLSSISHHRTIIQEHWLQCQNIKEVSFSENIHFARCLVKVYFVKCELVKPPKSGKDYGKKIKRIYLQNVQIKVT